MMAASFALNVAGFTHGSKHSAHEVRLQQADGNSMPMGMCC
jgi:hypothetical protein